MPATWMPGPSWPPRGRASRTTRDVERLESSSIPSPATATALCAELLPELIVLDDWGYPVVAAGGVPPRLEKHARRAVAACPKLAFTLRRTDGRASSPVSLSGRR